MRKVTSFVYYNNGRTLIFLSSSQACRGHTFHTLHFAFYSQDYSERELVSAFKRSLKKCVFTAVNFKKPRTSLKLEDYMKYTGTKEFYPISKSGQIIQIERAMLSIFCRDNIIFSSTELIKCYTCQVLLKNGAEYRLTIFGYR